MCIYAEETPSFFFDYFFCFLSLSFPKSTQLYQLRKRSDASLYAVMHWMLSFKAKYAYSESVLHSYSAQLNRKIWTVIWDCIFITSMQFILTRQFYILCLNSFLTVSLNSDFRASFKSIQALNFFHFSAKRASVSDYFNWSGVGKS